jgi:hypothetical protein
VTSQDPDRIPLSHSVRYAARGLPEVPHRYHGRGVLVPSEITLTYRAAPDSQLGRIHAYLAGRIHVDGVEIPHDGLYGQHYDEGLDDWPHWLTEEARQHDPDAASVSRSAVLLEAADAVAADTAHIRYGSATDYAERHAALLRQLAAEAHDGDTQDDGPSCPRSSRWRASRFLDALTHSGPGYDLSTPAAPAVPPVGSAEPADDEATSCDGCGHPEHAARECPVTQYGERCACDEPIAASAQGAETTHAEGNAQPSCSAALLPFGRKPAEPCVRKGRHKVHCTAEGCEWTNEEADRG